MTARHLLSLTAAAGALTAAAPALAQAPIPAPPYEYAQPAPPPVVFDNQPVIQPVPVPPSAYHADEYPDEYDTPPPPMTYPRHPVPQALPPQPVMHHEPIAAAPMMHHAPMAPTYPGSYPGAYPGAHSGAYPGMPGPYGPHHAGWSPPFDRDGWLDDCRDRIRGADRRERGGIIGGLLGAIGGGIAGNRIADGERLAGTLIGAGVGGLAGLAIGAVIGAAADRDRMDECEFYLDRYLTAYPGHATPGYGYPAYTYTYVPVVVAVPQRAIVREHVTTEWVDVPAPATRTVTRSKIVRQPAPKIAPGKIVPVKRVRSVKGK